MIGSFEDPFLPDVRHASWQRHSSPPLPVLRA
jgi:hypothetical protein